MSKDKNQAEEREAVSTTKLGIFFFVIGLICLGVYFWCLGEVRTDDFERSKILQDIARIFSIVAFCLLFGSLPMIFGKAETIRVILTLIVLGAFVPVVPLIVGFIIGGLTLIANLVIAAITFVIVAILFAIFGGGGETIAVIFFIKK